ncbi:helix-turn-helix domain-containing protein [Streptomyces sp. NPDC001982]|uniref:PucR family transcriptional regulator n=1 Tax=Streptomyces sp. NPDC001982 TaxID=3154405 RepID=UPI00332A6338
MRNNLEPNDYPALASVTGSLLAQTERLVESQMDALLTVAPYRNLPRFDLEHACRRNVARVVATLGGTEGIPAELTDDVREVGRQRAMQGITSEDLIGAYRLVMAVLRDAFVDECLEHEIPADVVLRGVRQLWNVTDQLSNEMLAARSYLDIELAQREAQQRISFMQAILNDRLSHADLKAAVAAYGLLPDAEYRVCRSRNARADDQRMMRCLEMAASGVSSPIVGPVDGDLVAILDAVPRECPAGALIVVSTPKNPLNLASGFAEATRILNVAVKFGMSGVVTNSDLGIRIAVAEEQELGQMLHTRYIDPVLNGSSSPEQVLESVSAFLRWGRHVATCADKLSIHQNTLRYRLERYEALSGADLSDTEGLLETWWALEYWRLRRDEAR